MTTYEQFSDVKLSETGLISPNKHDVVYNRLVKNGITNLEELFTRYDNNEIDYGYHAYIMANQQTIGTVNLLRYKYLGKDLPILHMLEGLIISEQKQLRMEKKASDRDIVPILTYMGLGYNFSINLMQFMYKDEKLITFLSNYLKDPFIVNCTKNESKCSIEKLKLILAWYYSLKKDINSFSSISEVRNRINQLQKILLELQEEQRKISQKIKIVNAQIGEAQNLEQIILQRTKNHDEFN